MVSLLLGAAQSDVQTYLPTIFSSAGILALLTLLWRIVRSSDKDKGERISKLHTDIKKAEDRNKELGDMLEAAEDQFRREVRRADQLEYDGMWCARRLDFLLDVLEEHGIEIPLNMKPQRKDGP